MSKKENNSVIVVLTMCSVLEGLGSPHHEEGRQPSRARRRSLRSRGNAPEPLPSFRSRRGDRTRGVRCSPSSKLARLAHHTARARLVRQGRPGFLGTQVPALPVSRAAAMARTPSANGTIAARPHPRTGRRSSRPPSPTTSRLSAERANQARPPTIVSKPGVDDEGGRRRRRPAYRPEDNLRAPRAAGRSPGSRCSEARCRPIPGAESVAAMSQVLPRVQPIQNHGDRRLPQRSRRAPRGPPRALSARGWAVTRYPCAEGAADDGDGADVRALADHSS